MTTTVETYLNSLPEDILTVDISCSRLTSLPDLTRFKNLQELHCYNNDLTSLPDLSIFKILVYNNHLHLLIHLILRAYLFLIYIILLHLLTFTTK